jgi:hypothetical protein
MADAPQLPPGFQVYPAWRYHPTLPAAIVKTPEADVALHESDEGWVNHPTLVIPPTPVVESLNPNTAVIGVPSFDLHVVGSGFTRDSVIVFNGHDEPTTIVSPTELTTGINMAVWLGPSEPLPVLVKNGDVESNALTFTFTAEGAAPESAVVAGRLTAEPDAPPPPRSRKR